MFFKTHQPQQSLQHLFRNNRDILQVQTLGRQIFGKQCSYFMDAYNKATSLPWGYILINLHPKTRQNTYKFITHIIPGEMTIVYLPRNEPINWMEELNSSSHEQGQQGSNMGNLCCRTIPNINLSCINNGMISSCCKSDSKSTEMPTFYKWISPSDKMRGFFATHLLHGLRILHNVMKMHYTTFKCVV